MAATHYQLRGTRRNSKECDMDRETRDEFNIVNSKIDKLMHLTEEKNVSIRNGNTEIKINDLPAFISLKDAIKLKGGSDSMATWRTNYAIQPAMGTNSVRIAGVRSWAKEIILEWLTITDEMLPAYAEKWGVPLPEKYKKYVKEK